MEYLLHSSWSEVLKDEFSKPYFLNLVQFVESSYKNSTCYPDKNQIFSAFNHCSFEELQVVIIGQDPYHGEGQANGLCFSVNDGIPFPPSLQNIFKEIREDLGIESPVSGNLERWANQGVLLLNAILTVEKGHPGSHQNQGWDTFTDSVIEQISQNKTGIIFLLWGTYAQKKGTKIDRSKHFVLTSGHPSPMSANRGYWFGNKHFSETNQILKKLKKVEILW